MIDAHVHIFHGNSSDYSLEHINRFIEHAQKRGIAQLYLLEHTHQFIEFRNMYRPIEAYSEYQKNWLSNKLRASMESYIRFVDSIRNYEFPITVKFGLEVCYIPDSVEIMLNILKQFELDFLTGAIHYIDNWGFDHRSEFWNGVDVDGAYKRYYEIMLDMIALGVFTGVAHPDSIKCFGNYPHSDMSNTYKSIATALNNANMYVEHSGGLGLNYGFSELGMNADMLKVFQANKVNIITASDAHRPEHAGANILKLYDSLKR